MTNLEAIQQLELQRVFTNTSNAKVEAIDKAIEALKATETLKLCDNEFVYIKDGVVHPLIYTQGADYEESEIICDLN